MINWERFSNSDGSDGFLHSSPTHTYWDYPVNPSLPSLVQVRALWGTARVGSYFSLASLASLANDAKEAAATTATSEPAKRQRLGIGHLPGRCPECEAHIETQGHNDTCSQARAS